jgi:isocitrate dehydrogenase kinase/phosphatase
MSLSNTDHLAQLGAQAIRTAFGQYHAQFKGITSRAPERFEMRDWPGAYKDAAKRLDLYSRTAHDVVAKLRLGLGDAAQDKQVWTVMKQVYSSLIAHQPDFEIAETFYNSITRRLFTTVGVDPNIEFVASDFDLPLVERGPRLYQTYPRADLSVEAWIAALLRGAPFRAAWEDQARDAALIARRIEAHIPNVLPDSMDVVRALFFRGKGAYVVGRLRRGGRQTPLVIALRHTERGIYADAVLLNAAQASVVFSFTRAYFHVECDCPRNLVIFLKSILPHKRLTELYTTLGYNKHGKTELYRELLDHLAHTAEQFEPAWGDKGMVMSVFTLPTFNVVFKIIKDRFPYPKTATRQEVMAKYQLVFKHDRAGRLVDAQEFEHLEFDRARFRPEVLAELQAECGQSVRLSADRVAIAHLYTERRVTPLNLYLRQADLAAAREAVLDYGQAIRDLAATNIFPGDMLLKNFGVTRQGRVIFYDYDELCAVTDCKFRDLPQASDYDEETSSEPWFYVGEDDIFPEEFLKFFGLSGPLREAFVQAHGELLTADFWRGMQTRHRAREIVDIFPYKAEQRLGRS